MNPTTFQGRAEQVLVALDKFKGSIDAVAACRAVADGIRTATATAVIACPIADGGDGTIDALVSAGYGRIPITAEGPLGHPVDASFAVTGTTAVVELAQICGLQQLPAGTLEPWRAGTVGLGIAVLQALDHGAQHIVLALGGSASTDGGVGLLTAMGACILDSTGRICPPNADGMMKATHLDLSGMDPRAARTRFSVATDVSSPLTGPHGAATVFGPQKGLTGADVAALDHALQAWAELLCSTTGVDAAELPGAGAAGGTAVAAIAVLKADVISGAEFVLDAIGFDQHLAHAGLVVIGEGSWDDQSEAGKAPMAVLNRATRVGTPVVVVAGRIAATPERLTQLHIQRSYQLLDLQSDPMVAMRDAAALLHRVGHDLAGDSRSAGYGPAVEASALDAGDDPAEQPLMKALRFYGAKDLRLDEIPRPRLQAGQVLIEVAWCGICGTDLHEFQAGPIFIPSVDRPHPLTGEILPVVMGHEFAGTVVQIAPDVTDIAVGDQVAVEPLLRCDTCAQCVAGRYNICERGGVYGLAGRGGGLAEYCAVDRRNAHILPPGVGTDIGALVEPLAVSWHAMVQSGFRSGQTALVIGAGPIGLALVLCLKAVGAHWIGVSEPSQARKSQAALFGADQVYDPFADDIVDLARAAVEGVGPHITFDTSGLQATINTALAAVRPTGTVFNVAIWEGMAPVDMSLLLTGERTLRSGLCYAGDYPAVIAALSDGRIHPVDMITARINLEEVVSHGFVELIDNKDQHIKILVRPGSDLTTADSIAVSLTSPNTQKVATL